MTDADPQSDPDLNSADTHTGEANTSQTITIDRASGGAVAQVHLKPRKSRPFYGRHPWVLDSAIGRITGQPSDGDVVDLISDKDRFVARGIYNSQSRLRVRLYSWEPSDLLNEDFWRKRLQDAITLRKHLGYLEPDGACRLVYSEADGLSGLIVDRFGPYLSVQLNSLAMSVRFELIQKLLVELMAPRGIVVRNERGVPQLEGLEHREGLTYGQAPEGPIFISEHGIRYGVDLIEGQKTGFYVDQRENRLAAAAYMRDRRVLDLCCYSGGFGLTALLRGQARDVLAVDSSAKALALAKANAGLNGVSSIHFEALDCFDMLDKLTYQRDRFGAVILDPPKFARSRQSLEDALKAYHRLNRLAASLLEPGGILVTCSCSGHVSREDFMFMLAGVSQQINRPIQVLEQRGAAPDHPVRTTCLESQYLKCFICRVE